MDQNRLSGMLLCAQGLRVFTSGLLYDADLVLWHGVAFSHKVTRHSASTWLPMFLEVPLLYISQRTRRPWIQGVHPGPIMTDSWHWRRYWRLCMCSSSLQEDYYEMESLLIPTSEDTKTRIICGGLESKRIFDGILIPQMFSDVQLTRGWGDGSRAKKTHSAPVGLMSVERQKVIKPKTVTVQVQVHYTLSD